MNEPEHLSKRLQDLIDDYLSGLSDEAATRELEDLLRADADARRYFVRYARLQTDLHLEMRARRASARAIDRINRLTEAAPTPAPGTAATGNAFPRWRLLRRFWPKAVAAACLALVLGAGWWFLNGRPEAEPAIAWLVNAQNCQWSRGEPTGDMQAGKSLGWNVGWPRSASNAGRGSSWKARPAWTCCPPRVPACAAANSRPTSPAKPPGSRSPPPRAR